MNKYLYSILLGSQVALIASNTAFASGWMKDDHGWWYSKNDTNTEWYSNGWYWIDDDYDGIAECFWFNEEGYIVENFVSSDGYTCNSDGEWHIDGVVQQKKIENQNPKLTNSGIGWRKDDKGWWYSKNEAGTSWYVLWNWLDDDGDGIQKCYYFGHDGYLVTNQTISGSYTVNEKGEWVVDGVVCLRDPSKLTKDGLPKEELNGHEIVDVADAGFISINYELGNYIDFDGEIGLKEFFEKYPSELIKEYPYREDWTQVRYSSVYNNKPLKIMGFKERNTLRNMVGTVSQLMIGVPDVGIESNTLLKACGYEKGGIFASTGTIDGDFGLETGKYRMLHMKDKVNDLQCFIVVTIGTDEKWYIYPDSQMLLSV